MLVVSWVRECTWPVRATYNHRFKVYELSIVYAGVSIALHCTGPENTTCTTTFTVDYKICTAIVHDRCRRSRHRSTRDSGFVTLCSQDLKSRYPALDCTRESQLPRLYPFWELSDSLTNFGCWAASSHENLCVVIMTIKTLEPSHWTEVHRHIWLTILQKCRFVCLLDDCQPGWLSTCRHFQSPLPSQA